MNIAMYEPKEERNEPMTTRQASFLKSLCEKHGEEFEPSLTKAEASRRIDELKRSGGSASR